MMQNELALGIDLGGTNIKVALLDGKLESIEEATLPTVATDVERGKRWKQDIGDLVKKFQKKSFNAIEVVGIAAPGLANSQNTSIAHLPNKLPGLENFYWEDFLGIKTFVLNDAHAALVAESRLGAGKGFQNIVLFTLGTGVGGGVIIDGKLLQGQKGRAGHFGHFSINQNEEQSIANMPGSLENAIGECSMKRRSYGKFHSTKEVVGAHLQGDHLASWVWLNSVQQLARGIASLLNAFSPEVVILGGGITKAGDALMLPLQNFLDVYEWRPGGFQTPIKFATLGRKAGAVGAVLFAKEKANQTKDL